MCCCMRCWSGLVPERFQVETGLKALAKPELKAQLEKPGAVIVADPPSDFAAYLKRGYER